MSTAIYPNRGNNLVYPVLGLNGEAGEIAEKLKKIIRDSGGELSPESRKDLSKELGDILWYVAACCDELGLRMDSVASANIAKLASRKERGQLSGSGDNR
jgi:NTP pyrophosphatase (non-canonical NTP hydrolase)|tara:strand:- start:276 stop:575 length:300 start_codon:yes stop_codon:yes gene_type:complete